MAADQVAFAVRKCPFLHKVAAQHGEEYASNLAVCPIAPAGGAGPRSTEKDAALYAASFNLFHGPQGIVPLVSSPTSSTSEPPAVSGCPFHSQALAAAAEEGRKPRPSRPAPLPLASISLSFGSGPNFGDFFRNKHKHNSSSGKPKRAPGHGHAAGSSSAPNAGAGASSQHPSSSGPAGSGSGGGSFKPQRPLTDPSSGAGHPGSVTGSSKGTGWSNPGAGGGRGLQPPSATAAGRAPPSINPPTGSGPGGAVNGGGGWHSMSSSAGSGTATPASHRGPTASGSAPAGQQCAQPGAGASNPGRSSGGRLAGSSSGAGNLGRSGRKMRSSGGGGGGRAPLGSGGRLAGSSSGAGNPGGAGNPACPLRKWLGPVGGLVFNQYDKLICPPAIVAARAALAKTAAVQTLRPQALPVKLVAVAAVAAAANLPCGAVREHFEKFSTGWFIAVHATIPFVAMLRKAVIMPKYAMVVTIAAAVLGQVVGSRLERLRLQQLEAAGAPASHLQGQAAVSVSVGGAAVLQPPRPSRGAAPDLGHSGGDSSRVGAGEGAANWREKLLAGAAEGFAGLPQAQPLQLPDCVREVVTGLGSLMPALPVVRA